MSDPDTGSADPSDAHDAPAPPHGHGSTAEPLGPVDMATWGYAIAGGAVGVILMLALFVAGGG